MICQPRVCGKVCSYITDSSIISRPTVDEAIDFYAHVLSKLESSVPKDIYRFFRLNLKDEHRSPLERELLLNQTSCFDGAGYRVYILMDEPFSGIDVFTGEEIARVYKRIYLMDGAG